MQTLYSIAITHPRTGETAKFLGQGQTIVDALSDGGKTITTPYRQSSDGRVLPAVGLGMPPRLAVTLPSGAVVLRERHAFESGTPYDAAREVRPHDLGGEQVARAGA